MPKKLILIIEDEPGLIDLLRYNLEKEGYGTFAAHSGEKGLELARSKKPDLILLDLMLPQIDGLEVCRILKRDPRTESIPVLILSAKSSEIDQVVGLETGASDYQTKPFSMKVLLTRIKKLLSHSEISAKEINTVQVGDYLLDRDSVRFFLAGREVYLTKTEFGILSAFMDRPEIVLSREQLVNLVWGSGSIVSEASVNMQIKALREKLGKHYRCLETVRGLGYRFTNKNS